MRHTSNDLHVIMFSCALDRSRFNTSLHISNLFIRNCLIIYLYLSSNPIFITHIVSLLSFPYLLYCHFYFSPFLFHIFILTFYTYHFTFLWHIWHVIHHMLYITYFNSHVICYMSQRRIPAEDILDAFTEREIVHRVFTDFLNSPSDPDRSSIASHPATTTLSASSLPSSSSLPYASPTSSSSSTLSPSPSSPPDLSMSTSSDVVGLTSQTMK